MGSVHFTQEELTHTATGLPNEPNDEQVASLARLVSDCLEPMRAIVGPMRVNSGFRSREVNEMVGGVPTSQHTKGEAADVFPLEVSPAVLFDLTRASRIPFDQLILEPNWVHVSVPHLGHTPRRQALKAYRVNGKMHYIEVSNGPMGSEASR